MPKDEISLDKEKIDKCLKELAKIYRKKAGKGYPAELILIGGASIIVNYGFRPMTQDIDAVYYASSVMKDAIREVGDKNGLPEDWMNNDFINTSSYSDKLRQFSTYYRTYSNVVQVRTISEEYLIAMKLKSARNYKNDFSDVIGILMNDRENQNQITLNNIMLAAEDLYGSWYNISENARTFIGDLFETQNLEMAYREQLQNEKEKGENLKDFMLKHRNIKIDENNANRIAEYVSEQKEELRSKKRSAKKAKST